jgi:hypothetical protein
VSPSRLECRNGGVKISPPPFLRLPANLRTCMSRALTCLPAYLLTCLPTVQTLPPPRDENIRVVFYELLNQSEISLTLEPKARDGKPAPTLHLAYRFAGKTPTSSPTEFELRAYVGMFWAPRPELSLTLDDDEPVELSGTQAIYSELAMEAVTARLSIDALRQIANARRVTGSALGFPVELSTSQIRSVGIFLDRVRAAHDHQPSYSDSSGASVLLSK